MSSAAHISSEPAVSSAALEAVLEVLLLRCHVEVRPDLVRRAALDGALEGEQSLDWTAALDVAATATGLRLRWTQASADEAARLCRPDLPVVGRTTTGALAQCVASALSTPLSSTERMEAYALSTSNAATS